MARDRQDALYTEASTANAAAIRRVARGYEADPDLQRDLLQEIHLELWTSFASFDGRCGLRTWVFRIAHNVGVSHAMRDRRLTSRLVDLETLEARISFDGEAEVERRYTSAILLDLIRRLKPLDRQVIMLYLEGEVAGSIAEVTGITAVNVATKIHRIKRMLKQKYLEGASDAKTARTKYARRSLEIARRSRRNKHAKRTDAEGSMRHGAIAGEIKRARDLGHPGCYRGHRRGPSLQLVQNRSTVDQVRTNMDAGGDRIPFQTYV